MMRRLRDNCPRSSVADDCQTYMQLTCTPCVQNGVGEARYANCAVSYLRGGGRREARGQVPSAGKARFRDEDGSLRDGPNDNSAIRSGRVALRKNFHTEDGWRRG